jgi:hypothetical protein
MLKFENTANVGDTIKAYDFQPMDDRPDMYIEGVVVSKGDCLVEYMPGVKVSQFQGYTINVTKSVSGIKENTDFDQSRVGSEMYVPFQMSMLEYDNRVVKVSE